MKKYLWISIDGTDAVGKTMLTRKLVEYLKRKYPRKKFISLKEFSNHETGIVIKKIIKKRNFFTLGKRCNYPLAETIMLYADLVLQLEKVIFEKHYNQKIFIISDRGPFSFLTYQALRIRRKYKNNRHYLQWLDNSLQLFGFPDISIFLISDPEDIKKRLIKRRDKVNKESIEFIKMVQKEYLKTSNRHKSNSMLIIKNKQGEAKKTFDKAIAFIENHINKINVK